MRRPRSNKSHLKNIWSQVPADYYFNLNFFQSLWHEWKWLIIKHLLNSTANKAPRKILDIGCASGHVTILLAKHYPQAQVIGVDAYSKAVKYAKRKFSHLEFLVADAHHLPFVDNEFDLIVSSETIEHVAKPDVVLKETSRVLNNQGKLILEMDSGSWLFKTIWHLWTHLGKGKVWHNSHLHPLNAKRLQNLLVQQNFSIEKKIISHMGMAVTFLASPAK